MDFVFICIAAVVAGLARGFSGFGGALIFVPLASATVGPQMASAVLLVVDGIMTLGMLPNAWRHANRREVFTMVSGAVVGIPAGTALLALAPSLAVRWVICCVVLLLLIFLISGRRYQGTPKTYLTVMVGTVAGLFGGAAQISGPPVVAYWLGGAFPANTVRANLVVYFALSSVLSATAYFFAGLLTFEVLKLAAIVALAYGLGIFVGARAFGMASESTFRWISFGLIACAAIVGLPLLDFLRSS
jgi:uncharacterized membrane protein YfcA